MRHYYFLFVFDEGSANIFDKVSVNRGMALSFILSTNIPDLSMIRTIKFLKEETYEHQADHRIQRTGNEGIHSSR